MNDVIVNKQHVKMVVMEKSVAVFVMIEHVAN
jgi:hypothetical protein